MISEHQGFDPCITSAVNLLLLCNLILRFSPLMHALPVGLELNYVVLFEPFSTLGTDALEKRELIVEKYNHTMEVIYQLALNCLLTAGTRN